MERCFFGGQAYGTETGVAGQILGVIGTLVELHIDGDYIAFKRADGRNSVPFPLPGATEYFDVQDDSCASLASFLKQRNPIVDEVVVREFCRQRKIRDTDKMLVPDIITHEAELREFYEIKPKSPSGLKDAAQKIRNFKEMIAGQQVTYQDGVRYSPDGKQLLFSGTWAMVPIRWHLRWSRVDGALIAYKFCAEISNATLQDAALFLALRMMLLMLFLSKHPVFATGAAATVFLLLPNARSPLLLSVGDGGANRDDDARYVQLLLNDFRVGRGSAPILVDGLVGPETIEAIQAFQQEVTGVADGRVDPGGPAMAALERLHFESGAAGVSEEFGDTARRQEMIDDASFLERMTTDEDEETILEPVAMATGEIEAYLAAVHDSGIEFTP